LPQAVAILLIAQMVLAAIALFVLLDGVQWVLKHVRLVAICTVLIAGSVAIALTIPWGLTERTVTAWGFTGIMGAACAATVSVVARHVWKKRFRTTMRTPYLSERAEDEWLVFDGQVEIGPFSTAD
jgi:hypothetical protein